jgi:hypothetical protein
MLILLKHYMMRFKNALIFALISCLIPAFGEVESHKSLNSASCDLLESLRKNYCSVIWEGSANQKRIFEDEHKAKKETTWESYLRAVESLWNLIKNKVF